MPSPYPILTCKRSRAERIRIDVAKLPSLFLESKFFTEVSQGY